ncbi:hypothetical protein P154DRAFT_536536 [Amniculicola lignicola CBS 123094]|uniref:Rhodopsin domain-containing protein n=1 Tax=Amniculicola lignicola CBS 123094 TaxID=1392246 RepID=A0A6A5WBF0_9PLEO|nr:hypothetical protein P154DRAFT_536536 [Amniculicola lignicola CBS 123094]
MAGEGIPEGMDLATLFAVLTPEEKKMFYQGPAMLNPDGSPPNFQTPQNQNALAPILLITGAVLSTLVVSVRVYPPLLMGKTVTMQLSDYLVVAAWAIFGVYMYYVYSIAISPGIFVHQWNVRYIDLVHMLYKVSAGSALYGSIICLTKVAILLDWLHLFVPRRTRNTLAWVIYIVITVNSVIHLVSDLVIVVLPQKVIWGLRMSREKRAGISALFAIGIFACVCAAVRMVYSVRFMKSEDITYSVSPTGLWSVGDMTSAFLIAGVPSLPRILKEAPWVRKLFTWIRSISGASSKGSCENSAKELPSWYKNRPSVRMRQEDAYSELDEDMLVEISIRDGRHGRLMSS